MVTRRIKPLKVDGRVVHQVGLPFHWSFAGEVVGGQANDLTSLVADPNVSMHEAKAFVVDVVAGQAPQPQPRPTKPTVRFPMVEPIADTPPGAQPEGRTYR
jgi:formate dehydrogenase major subunit